MKDAILGLAALLWLSGCAVVPADGNLGMKNACLPEAIICREALLRKWIPAKAIEFEYTEKGSPAGHAITVYEAGNTVWFWDSSMGSRYTDLPFNSSPIALARAYQGLLSNPFKVGQASLVPARKTQ